jgi:hypothetical protein
MARRRKIGTTVDSLDKLETPIKTEDLPEAILAEKVMPTKSLVPKKRIRSLVTTRCRYGTAFIELEVNKTYELPVEIADWLIKSNRCI